MALVSDSIPFTKYKAAAFMLPDIRAGREKRCRAGQNGLIS
jgi:hypothetical protein